MSTINQIDVAIGRYYNSLNRNYDRDFAIYCEDNGIEDYGLQEEVNEKPEDSMLVDFDSDFPFKVQPKTDEKKQTFIHKLIKDCYHDPNWEPPLEIPQVNEEFFKITIDEMKRFRRLLISQCPQISVYIHEESLITLMAIENKNKMDYLSHLYAIYHQDKLNSLNNRRNALCLNKWTLKNQHFEYLNRLSKTARNSNRTYVYNMVENALYTLNKRMMPLLQFQQQRKIDDSLEITVRYICAATDYIQRIIKESEGSVFPFQLDFCINYGASISRFKPFNNGYDLSDDSDDSDDVNERDKFVDIIGDIKSKLEKNGLKYEYIECRSNSVGNTIGVNIEYVIARWNRIKDKAQHIPNDIIGVIIEYFGVNLFNLYDDFIARMEETFPKYKRFVTFIDRRKKSENIDQVWMYECPSDCSDIPSDAVSFWYFNASQTCLLPNMEYDDVFERRDTNINVRKSCGGSLLTFSFHVKNKNCVRCYLHWNGQTMRFMPQYIKIILPIIFSMETNDNREFLENHELTQLIHRINKTLIDREFDAFYALHPCKQF